MKKKGMSALTWIIALAVIVFMLFVFYIPATLFISKKIGKPEANVELKQGQNTIDTNNLIALLNTPVLIDGKQGQIKDLAIKAGEDKYAKQLEEEVGAFIKVFNSNCIITRANVISDRGIIGEVYFGIGLIAKFDSKGVLVKQDYSEINALVDVPYNSGVIKFHVEGEC